MLSTPPLSIYQSTSLENLREMTPGWYGPQRFRVSVGFMPRFRYNYLNFSLYGKCASAILALSNKI